MNVLVLVHPGSLCGSANCNLGYQEARAVRDAVIADLNSWDGNVLVLDGELSDELDGYPALQQAINDAVARAPVFGRRIEADDPEHAQLAVEFLESRSVPRAAAIAVTGAWYDPSEFCGCVNSTRQALQGAGFSCVEVLESCALLDCGPDLLPALV